MCVCVCVRARACVCACMRGLTETDRVREFKSLKRERTFFYFNRLTWGGG